MPLYNIYIYKKCAARKIVYFQIQNEFILPSNHDIIQGYNYIQFTELLLMIINSGAVGVILNSFCLVYFSNLKNTALV